MRCDSRNATPIIVVIALALCIFVTGARRKGRRTFDKCTKSGYFAFDGVMLLEDTFKCMDFVDAGGESLRISLRRAGGSDEDGDVSEAVGVEAKGMGSSTSKRIMDIAESAKQMLEFGVILRVCSGDERGYDRMSKQIF